MRRALLILVTCVAVAACTGGRAVESGAAAVAATITPAGLETHLRALGHDSMEGRGTGTRGYERAARYVVRRFEALALEPAGTRGYLQPVRLRRAHVRSAFLVLGDGPARRELVPGRDFIGIPHMVQTEAEVRAPVVFAGFGVTAPGRGHDDYAGIDVRGKIVAVLTGAPASFPATERAHYSTTREKAGSAASRGAVGMLILRSRDFPQPWAQQVGQAKAGAMRWLDADGMPHDVFSGIRAVAALSDSGAAALFANAARPWAAVVGAAAQDNAPALDLGITASIHITSTHEHVESANAAGLLRGSDPALAHEVVVVSAHLDHLGIAEPVGGDSIYNGVWDNASGVAAMLEIARAAAQETGRPRRSLLFLAVTAEELGLLGSDYFAEHPTVPIERIVANVNLDGLSIFYPLREMVAHGAIHSTLEETARRAAARLGLAIVPDPIPEQAIFVRSDQYSFVRRGVPSIFFFTGLRSAPGVDGPALFREWLTTRYHTPRDDLQQPRDLAAGALHATLALFTALDIANADRQPAWKAGDFFGTTYGRR